MKKQIIHLESNSLTDVFNVAHKKYWEYTKVARKAIKNATVIIRPTAKAVKESELNPIVTIATLVQIVEGGKDKSWENSKTYNHRYILKNITEMPYVLAEEIFNVSSIKRGIKYMEI